MRREELTMNVDAQVQKSGEFVCQSCFMVKRTSQLRQQAQKDLPRTVSPDQVTVVIPTYNEHENLAGNCSCRNRPRLQIGHRGRWFS